MSKLRLIALALALGAGALIGGATPNPASIRANSPADPYVASWDIVGLQALGAAKVPPAHDGVILTYQAIAVHDAVMAIDGSYEPFAVDVDAPEGASMHAAVAAAAHGVLVHYLPEQAAGILDPAYAGSLETIPDGQAKSDGVAVGEQAAAMLIEQRADDGFATPPTYSPQPSPAPGAWIPTAETPPIGVFLATMEPFSLDSADQFRPAAPPALTSEQWARDYAEVQQVGSEASAVRTEEQSVAARFWAEPPTPQEHASFRNLIAERELDVVEAARLMAMVTVANTDALIACFDAKYHFEFWRPITAIRAGDTDGNDATAPDPDWTPLLPATPNHPEYPAAHTCNSSATGRAIAGFLGTTEIDLTMISVTGLGDRHFATAADLDEEVANARLWGGIHFRTAVETGSELGIDVADHVLADFAGGGMPRVCFRPCAV
jgi:hypothetical protein